MNATNRTLEGRTALVTGGVSGIGLAAAEALAASDARVIVHGRTDRGRDVAKAMGATFLQADLASRGATNQLADQALAVSGCIDILVNNAGYQHVAPVEEFPEDIFAAMQQVMLVAPFQLSKRLLPAMRVNGWGRIINVASTQGLVASAYKSAYAAAKHGVVGLTRALALECGADSITVNAVCPAYVRTPLVEGQIASQAKELGISEEEVVSRVMLEPAAVKRLIEPEEVARVIAYLASEEAAPITGSALPVDAGWLAR